MSDNKDAVTAPLAIIGIGCLFPKAGSMAEYWSNIKNGVDGITAIPASHWSPEDYYDKDPKKPDFTYAKKGGFLGQVDFDPAEFGIAPNAVEATDSAQLLGLVAAQAALRDAGYGPEKDFDRSRVSVILGVTGTLELVVPLGARLGHPIWRKALAQHGIEGEAAESIVETIKDGYVPWQENSFPGLLGNVVAGRIANRFNLGGTNCVVDAACASSLSAAHLASLELSTRRSTMVVTGGVDCFNDIFMYMCFSKTPALSPSGESRPFDKSADGTALGEGIGMVVLKRLDEAERDGDRIYAVLKGVGSSSDGRGKAIYAPSSEGQAKALRAAYQVAGVSPETVELVEAHGTGTSVGDGVEVDALKEVYSESARKDGPWCAIGSVKSMIGHTKAAAGSAGMIKAALSLYHKVLPPTIKVTEPIAQLASGEGPFYLNTQLKPWPARAEHPRRAAVSALGFGGSNFHAVLEEYAPKKAATDWDGAVELVAFSAADASALKSALSAWTAERPWAELAEAARASRASFDAQAPARLCFVVEKGKTELPKLAAAMSAQLDSGKAAWTLPEGAYFASGAAGKLAVLFPGQGSQYTGMLRDLACRFPAAMESLEAAGKAFEGDKRLADLIYPPTAFKDEGKAAQEAALRSTDAAQPALGAVSLGAYKVLTGFGLKASAFAGHSYGELAALCAAGRYDEETLAFLSGLRGRLMAQGGGDRGGMVAVNAALPAVEELIAAEGLDLVIANKNAPSQCVLSGATAEVRRAADILQKKGLKAVVLPVGAAFHSPLVAGAEREFRAQLGKAAFERSSVPVYANKTASPYPEAAEASRDILGSQLASPVEFVSMLRRMHDDGIRTFIEVGPGARLTGLVSACLEGRAFQALALDASAGRKAGLGDLARALAQLSALGHSLQLGLWEGDKPAAPVKKAKLSVKLTGANYRSSKPSAKAPVKVVPSTPPSASLRTEPSPMAPARPPAPVSAYSSDALRMAQDSMAALQRLQEQTAQLHLKFLESQEMAQRSFQALVEQQQALLMGGQAAAFQLPAPAPMPAMTLPAAPAPVPAPALAAPAPKPAPVPASNVDSVLLAIVSEKTGYPVETLNPDMDLESDLGIDSIKRVEILSAVHEKLPSAPRVKPEHLGTLRTLRQIAAFLSEGSAAAAPAAAPAASNVDAVLLAIVSEKTGYPVETLNPDMDLESDLGIDSIKRVEILSAVHEKLPSAPRVKPEHLGTLRTLRQIAAFLSEGSAAAAPAAAPAASSVDAVLLAIVSEKTGYPVETLNPDMDLESDLGIDSIKRVEILSAVHEKLPAAPRVKPEHLGTLRTLRQIAAFLAATDDAPQPPASESLSKKSNMTPTVKRSLLKLAAAPAAGPALKLDKSAPLFISDDGGELSRALALALQARGFQAKVIGLDAAADLRVRRPLGGLVLVAPAKALKAGKLWAAESEQFLKKAFLLAQAAAHGALFATVSRLDGAFGLNGLVHEQDPMMGGLAGLSKTASHEWTGVSCRAFDVASNMEAAKAAEALAQALLHEGPLELGLSAGGPKALVLQDAAEPEAGALPLKKGEVVLVTGGARGVTAEASVALAEACQPTLVLFGRTPLGAAEPAWLAACRTEAELKRAIAAELKLAPKEIGERCKAVLAEREIRAQLLRIERAGSRVEYIAVDLRDAKAVAAALKKAAALGPITGLVHGAGVLADKLITDKTPAMLDAVLDTKLAALRHVLGGLDLAKLKVLAMFSSTTARLGRTGQSDYAVANEALNKTAQLLARRLPDCKVVSFNWGPWDGGMVNEGLKKLFESQGVAVIGLAAGAKALRAELGSSSGTVEVVMLGASAGSPSAAPSEGALPKVFERELSLEALPVLKAHILGGRPVLPMAFIAELLGHAALHGNPGLVFQGFEDLRVYKGVALSGAQPYKVSIHAAKAVKQEGAWSVAAELRGKDGVLHAGARILLGAKAPAAPQASPRFEGPAYGPSMSEAYREFLFHGDELKLLKSVAACSPEGIRAEASTAPAPSAWVAQPWRDRWVADPAALDAAFQALILWSFERSGSGSLPARAGSYRQYGAFPKDGVTLNARVVRASEGAASADIDFLGRDGRLIARMEGYECTVDASLKAAFRRRELETA